MEVSGQLDAPAALSPGKDPCNHWIRAWVGPRAGADAMAKRKFPAHARIKSRSLVTILTELTQLQIYSILKANMMFINNNITGNTNL
jgi:hypothetical protein